jgi:hypothetical protein
MDVTETCNQTTENGKRGGSALFTGLVIAGAAILGKKIDDWTGLVGITKKGKAKKQQRAIKKLEKAGYYITRNDPTVEVKFEEPEPKDDESEVEENLD